MKSMIVEDGRKDLIAWKCETEDFEFGSRLVVHESQSAVFFQNGHALEVLGPGIHFLETKNLPFLKYLTKLRFGRLFHCEVYFVDHSVHMNTPWGTDRRVSTYLEVEPGRTQPLSVGASGGMNLQADPKQVVKFLTYLLGTGTSLTMEGIRQQFNSMLNMMVKSHLGNVLESSHWNVLSLDQHLEETSRMLKQRLEPEFEEYGLILREFHVSNFALPENEPAYQQAKLLQTQRYTQHGQLDLELELERKKREHDAALAEIDKKKTLLEAETEAQAATIKARGEAARRSLEGITSVQEHQFDIIEKMAESGGQGSAGGQGGAGGTGLAGNMSGLLGDVMKIGVEMQMAREMGGLMKDTMNMGGFAGNTPPTAFSGGGSAPSANADPGWTCSGCGAVNPSHTRFCGACGLPRSLPAAEWICPECQNKNPAGSRFCGICGKQRKEEQP